MILDFLAKWGASIIWLSIALIIYIHIRWALKQMDKKLHEMREMDRKRLSGHFTDRKDNLN